MITISETMEMTDMVMRGLWNSGVNKYGCEMHYGMYTGDHEVRDMEWKVGDPTPGGLEFDANRQYYIKKYGGAPGNEQW